MILLFLLCAYNSYEQFEWIDVNSSVNEIVLGNYEVSSGMRTLIQVKTI